MKQCYRKLRVGEVIRKECKMRHSAEGKFEPVLKFLIGERYTDELHETYWQIYYPIAASRRPAKSLAQRAYEKMNSGNEYVPTWKKLKADRKALWHKLVRFVQREKRKEKR